MSDRERLVTEMEQDLARQVRAYLRSAAIGHTFSGRTKDGRYWQAMLDDLTINEVIPMVTWVLDDE